MYTFNILEGGSEKLAQLIVDFYNGKKAAFDHRVKHLLPLSNEDQSKLDWKVKELHDGRQKFKEAVAWLCGSKPSTPRLFTLQDFGLEPLPEPSLFGSERDPITDESHHLNYLKEHGMKHFSLAPYLKDGQVRIAPQMECFVEALCAFLLAECAGKNPDEMPVKLCQGCGKLFSVATVQGKRRIKRSYCSKECQQAGWWTPERHKDDVYVKRLTEFARLAVQGNHGYTPSDLRDRLAKPKVRKRLREIKVRWASKWPTIIERVSEIEKASRGKNE